MPECKVIYRVRTPVTIEGKTGYLDKWSKDLEASTDEQARKAAEGAFLEPVSRADIERMNPAQQLKARAAWANAFRDEAPEVEWANTPPAPPAPANG